jgi:tetratricopeptide (TPR) repeat protein
LAAEEQGGDIRGRQSAAMVVVPPEGDPWRRTIDLRVEDHGAPLDELRRLLTLQRAYDLAGAADELLAAGRADEAGFLYRQAADLAPDSDELLFWSGLALAQSGDLAAGVAAVRRAAEENPNWLVLLERLSPEFAPAGQAVRQQIT